MIGTFTVLLAIIRALGIGEYSLYFIILKDVPANPIKKLHVHAHTYKINLILKTFFNCFYHIYIHKIIICFTLFLLHLNVHPVSHTFIGHNLPPFL